MRVDYLGNCHEPRWVRAFNFSAAQPTLLELGVLRIPSCVIFRVFDLHTGLDTNMASLVTAYNLHRTRFRRSARHTRDQALGKGRVPISGIDPLNPSRF